MAKKPKKCGEKKEEKRAKRRKLREEGYSPKITKEEKKIRDWVPTNRHHITPHSRGGTMDDWNILATPLRKHHLWHCLTSCLKLRPDELRVLLPYWIDEEDNVIRRKILGTAKSRQLTALRVDYQLNLAELTALLKFCYSRDGVLDESKLRSAQIRALKNIFGNERDIGAICYRIEEKKAEFNRLPAKNKKEWMPLIVLPEIRLNEMLVLLDCWFNSQGAIRTTMLSGVRLRQLINWISQFNLRPDEFILVLRDCYSDENGCVDFSRLRSDQKQAFKENLFDLKDGRTSGKIRVEDVVREVKLKWMSLGWIERSGCLVEC